MFAWKKPGKKGDMPITETSGGMIAIVFVVVAIGIVITLLGAFPQISDWFKSAFELSETTDQDYIVAKQSVEAVQCAINSIAIGDGENGWDDCLEEFKSSGGGLTGLAIGEETYSENGKVENGATVECKKTVTEGELICTVNNFQLPQEVAGAEKWIMDYGDPNMILRWGVFPQEEDTWTFRPDWRIHAMIAVISLIPPAKVAGAGIKTALTALKGPGKKVLTKTLAKELGEEFVEEIIEKGGKKELKWWLGEIAKEKGKRYFMNLLLKESLIDIVKDRFTKNGIKKMAIKGAILEGAVLFARFADSMSNKYEPEGNNLVLNSPFEDNELFALADELKGKPVIVNWEIGRFINTQKSAHLVSPCYLNYFDVRKDSIICSEYSYSSETGVTYCEDPKINSGDKYIYCGTFDETIDGYVDGEGVYEMIKEEIESENKVLFDGDGETIKIYVPLLSEDGIPEYITNIKQEEKKATKRVTVAGCMENDPEWEEGKPCYGTRSIYIVDIYRGKNSIGLSPVMEKENIVMEGGEEYVLHMYRIDNDLAFDIYPLDICKEGTPLVEFGQRWPGNENKLRKQMTCEEVNTITETVTTKDEIGDIAKITYDEKSEKKIRVNPDSDMKVRDIMVNLIPILPETLSENCGYDYDRSQCFRTLTSPVKRRMFCETEYTWDKENNGNLCHLDMDLDDTSDIDINEVDITDRKEFKILRDGSNELNADYYSVSTKFHDPRILIASAKKPGFVISFEDDDLEGFWDTIKAWEESDNKGIEGLFSGPDGIISLSNIDRNGVPQDYSMKNCYIQGIVIDFGDDLQKRMMREIDPNYCLRYDDTIATIFKWASIPITVTTIAFATFFAGPLGFYGVWGVLATGGLLDAGTSFFVEWKMQWP